MDSNEEQVESHEVCWWTSSLGCHVGITCTHSYTADICSDTTGSTFHSPSKDIMFLFFCLFGDMI